jgi:exopolyphosphatase / guanosine-5'-triphosphate,3'-diphosphate pyrophosphatase
MRIAVIDLGTNTFNVIVADVGESGFEVLHSTKEGVSLGMGGINEGIIARDAMERAFRAFKRFMDICVKYQVFSVRAIGTSALRDARNGHELLDKVRNSYGVEIEVIDGLREAKLIYDGVRWGYNFSEPSLIMDIGGGSTEFIRGSGDEPLQSCSLNIGVSRAVQMFDLSDPYSEDNKTEILGWFEKNSGDLDDFLPCTRLVGASGSFETFYEMITRSSFKKVGKAVSITRRQLDPVLDWLIGSTQEQRDKHRHIIPIRRKMAPIAALKTKWVLDKFGIEEIVVSPYALKEGVLRETHEQLKGKA